MHARIPRLIGAALLALACLAFVPTDPLGAASPESKQAELERIRSRMESIRKTLQAEVTRRDSLATELRAADLEVQAARRQLAQVRRERTANEQQMQQLQADRDTARRQLDAQQAALAEQLRAAYLNGRQEPLKVLLNQTDPARLGRNLTYYGYLTRARADRLLSIGERFEHLNLLTERINLAAEKLKTLEESSAQEVSQLAAARAERARTLATLQSTLKSRNEMLAKLERDANALEKLIAELRRALEEFPPASSEPFQQIKGQLPAPVKGPWLARFGEPRAGGPIRWQGLLIGAERGTQVRAPYQGRVVYADWLPGLGLLLVLDHGGGYLSLYGHNEQLYRRVGENVAPGDVLGAVGEAAGMSQPALYFEIRRGRQALDPAEWIKRPRTAPRD
jgi:septal ring factor EnvC (AmiA/AmiB activator)